MLAATWNVVFRCRTMRVREGRVVVWRRVWSGCFGRTCLLRSSEAYTTGEEDACKRTHPSWKGLGTALWLIEHLDALGYTYPTTIPIDATKRSVITILGYFEDEEDDDIMLEERMQLSASRDSRLWEWSFRGVWGVERRWRIWCRSCRPYRKRCL